MKLLKRTLFIVSLIAMSYVHAELLVIKKTTDGFAPLDASDEKNKVELAQTFLDYEWPMVIANTKLTKEEMDELLTAGKPNAEEEFIRAKVKEVNPNYDVVFVPTSLYELFAIGEISNAKEITWHPMQYAAKNPLELAAIAVGNDKFYPDAFMYINSQLIEKLFSAFHLIKEAQTTDAIANGIRTQSSSIAAIFINSMDTDNFLGDLIKKYEMAPKNPRTIKSNGALAQTIALEYEARALNKGLLLRATESIDIFKTERSVPWDEWLALPEEQKKTARMRVMGSTILSKTNLKSLAQAYKSKQIAPYSISFGNSLFAGIFNDMGACVYHYLTVRDRGGYALFIDKKEYENHRSFNLLRISSTPPLIALFEQGERFHSRTMAAAAANQQVHAIQGVANGPLSDYLTIENPLVHAELFAKYLAKNIRIIRANGASELSDAEKKIYEDRHEQETKEIKANHAELARYYKAIRTLEPFAKTAAEKVRKKLAEKKQAAEQAKEQE